MYFVCISCGKWADDGFLCAPYGWICLDCADKLKSEWREMGARSAVEQRETRPNGERESPLRLRRTRGQRYRIRRMTARGTAQNGG
jgi:hypothetical protein